MTEAGLSEHTKHSVVAVVGVVAAVATAVEVELFAGCKLRNNNKQSQKKVKTADFSARFSRGSQFSLV